MDQKRLTFGIMLSNRGPVLGYSSPNELISMAVAADQSKVFDTVWSGDAFLANPRLDSIALLSAVAGQTKRVRLGPACMGSFTLRNALDLAYQWASLDQISLGRSLMVACTGGGSKAVWDNEGLITGVNSKQRRQIMWERIQLFRRLWAEDKVTFHGSYHGYTDVQVLPKPFQKRPPIWAATNITRLASGTSAGRMPMKTLAQVGSVCDGWMTHSVNPQTFSQAWNHILKAATDEGKSINTLDNALVVNICVNDNPKQALAESHSFLENYYGIKFLTQRTKDWTAYGSAEECALSISAYVNSGVKHIALRITSQDQMGQFERLVNQVIPLVNKV